MQKKGKTMLIRYKGDPIERMKKVGEQVKQIKSDQENAEKLRNEDYNNVDSQYLSDNMNDIDIYRMTMGDNRENAETQRNWEQMMSDTAHQRETQDLLKAGLNPILSANNGASTPTGATATEGEMQTALKQQKAQFKQDKRLMSMQLDNAMEIANMQNAMSKYSIDKSYDAQMKGQAMDKWQTTYNASLQKWLAKYNGKLTKKQMKNAIKIAKISADAAMYGADTSASSLLTSTYMNNETQKWITDMNNELKKNMVTVKILGFSYSGYSGGLWSAYEEFKKSHPNSSLTFEQVQDQIKKGKGGDSSAG